MTEDELLAGLVESARARNAQDEAPPADERAEEALRPFDSDVRDRIVARIQAVQAEEQMANPVPAPAPVVSLAEARARRTPRRAWIGGAVAAFAAAALAVIALRPGVAPIVPYELTHSGGDAVARSTGPDATAPEARLRMGSRLRVMLRPASTVQGVVAARVFAVGADGAAQPLDVPVEISPDGAVKLDAVAGEELALTPGTWTLHVTVGRPDALPDAPAEATSARPDPATDGWQRLTLRLVLTDT